MTRKKGRSSIYRGFWGKEEKKASVASASPGGRIFKNVTISEGFFTLYDKFEAESLARVVFAREKY